jgi:two-component system, NarL family, nitrate/nitrite response regulator NarL
MPDFSERNGDALLCAEDSPAGPIGDPHQQTTHSYVPDDRAPRRQRQREIPTVIVDRSALFRAGVAHILSGTTFRVVSGFAALFEVPTKTLNRRPALLLLGLDMDATAVLAELALLRAALDGGLHTVMLSRFPSVEEFAAAVDAGGSAYLLKDEITPDVLLKSLDLVFLGAMVIPQEFAGSLRQAQLSVKLPELRVASLPGVDAVANEPQQPSVGKAGHGLSKREQAILEYLMRGASNKHIARELAIAEATVKVHVKSLLRKIQATNRTQAAMWAASHFRSSAE